MLNKMTLLYPLPEDVLKRKWAGDFDGEIELLKALLSQEIPDALRARLLVEYRVCSQLPRHYPYKANEVVARIRKRVPDFTERELADLELEGKAEYLYLNGEKHYHRLIVENLLKVDSSLRNRMIQDQKPPAKSSLLTVAQMIERGTVTYRIGIRSQMTLRPDKDYLGKNVCVYMPIPKPCAQQSQIDIKAQDGWIADRSAPQRTIQFQRTAADREPFEVSYSYVSRIQHIDLYGGSTVHDIVYKNEEPPNADDLSEQLPHIRFTPYLRSLKEQIRGHETDPLAMARRYYDYITQNIRYSFVRPYALIDDHAEYCAVNRKGDCGLMALLFIQLCRMSGIPARWQSGLEVDEASAGEHDWAQFYIEPFGWLFCDPSFGCAAYRSGDEVLRRFFFGNVDPFRMVANSRYHTAFEPAEDWERADPYDNQIGEAKVEGIGLNGWEFNTQYQTTVLEEIRE